MSKEPLRSLMTLEGDFVLPDTDLFDEYTEESQRHAAIRKVLLAVPEDDYRQLVDSIDLFQWFIPHHRVGAWIQPFGVTHPGEKIGDIETAPLAVVLYLSPALEDPRIDQEVLIGIVAHELAHIVLRHRTITTTDDEYDSQEKEANKRLSDWGFSEEWKKALEWHRELEGS